MFQINFRKLAEKDFGHSVTVRSLILNVLIRKGVEITVLIYWQKAMLVIPRYAVTACETDH